MVNNILESMAKALAWTQLTEKGKRECIWPDDWSNKECEEYRKQARAAFSAVIGHMYVPSEKMHEIMEATYKVSSNKYPMQSKHWRKCIWQATLNQLYKEVIKEDN